MAIVRNKLMVELYPTVQDVCEVISAVGVFHQGQEDKYLEAIKVSIEKRLEELKQPKGGG
ncbi:hypothetical protein [Paenibacillus glucanolyticus]|uniref:hypothetical protein n=1 Tax=Paenibacillus glucanolyticus TaxID=59843 RepID=UPI00096EE8DF|nr:hypothetical protein [Paenibacillus glucanolyticus]OMF70520.1 hypothetical protein BK142_23895 [Paenibacillus glucanolyticus]